MESLTLREKAIKLVFELPEEVLRQTIEEWEATLEILNNKELLTSMQQGEKEISRGECDRLEDIKNTLFGAR